MRTPQPELPLRIVVMDPVPGVWLRVQHGRDELVEPTHSSPAEVAFDVTVRVGAQRDGQPTFLGPVAQGPPAARFVYVNAGFRSRQSDSCWDRRAKIPLTPITPRQVEEVLARPGSRLEVRIPGRSKDGGPICATVPLPSGAWQVRDR